MKIRFLTLLLVLLLVLLTIPKSLSAQAASQSNRVSLAISGGASKGAYEAGLIWGLVEVQRKVEETGDWSLGGEPLPLEITSIAGTSAGGINTLLAALVWSVNSEKEGGFTNRIDDNIFRDVWLTPDVNRLLPPDADSPQYLTDDALLSRKDLVAVSRELRKKWNRPGTFRPKIRLPLGVTVTRVRPDRIFVSGIEVNNQRFYLPFELQTRADGSAAFSFDPGDYPSLTNPDMILMPWTADGEPFSISDQQVEDAILTTSAFPTGFGRKRLQYCQQRTFGRQDGNAAAKSIETGDTADIKLVCPDGYELTEAEFADGGLFDNLPLGLARLLSESSVNYKKMPLPVSYVFIEPDRRRFEAPEPSGKSACDSQDPPAACREMTFDFASESAVLGGAVGTARRYELYRELTGDNWQLNLSGLSRKIAEIMDSSDQDMACNSRLPFFNRQLGCSDRLRASARLLELSYRYQMTPITDPLSSKALQKEGVATACRPPSVETRQGYTAECKIDVAKLREQLANALIQFSTQAGPKAENLRTNIRRSALTITSDRSLQVTSRGGPVTGSLLGSFGAFLDYKFREFDYYVGIYDAVTVMSENHCDRNFPLQEQHGQHLNCRDQLSEELYLLVGVADDPKSRYVFARMAEKEFGKDGGMRFAYDPMPVEDRDMRIIFEGLHMPIQTASKDAGMLESLLPTERGFFEHLATEGFEPTQPPDGGKPILSLIMDNPDYWLSELTNRGTNRLMRLEKLAEAVYRAREPDPEIREKANTGLVGASALVLRTITYQYPKFTFSPSTAPENWFWRNIIPYETAFDLYDGDLLLFWQPTWNFKRTNAGLRMGLGFAGGLFSSSADDTRENYGTLGLDLTRIVNTPIFSGWGVTPAVYHNWRNPKIGHQTTFGFDVHATLFKNRVRLSLGVRDAIHDAEDTIFFLIGIADLPGLSYWLSR